MKKIKEKNNERQMKCNKITKIVQYNLSITNKDSHVFSYTYVHRSER